MPPKVGRKKLWTERTLASLPKGTLDRIKAVLRPGEVRTDFIRSVIEKEIRRRERLKARRKGKA